MLIFLVLGPAVFQNGLYDPIAIKHDSPQFYERSSTRARAYRPTARRPTWLHVYTGRPIGNYVPRAVCESERASTPVDDPSSNFSSISSTGVSTTTGISR